MIELDEPWQQCHFVYYCLEDKEVSKAGWYVCFRYETLQGKKVSWKIKSGPYKNEKLARLVGAEMIKDLGNPNRLHYRVFKLTKTKPTPKD